MQDTENSDIRKTLGLDGQKDGAKKKKLVIAGIVLFGIVMTAGLLRSAQSRDVPLKYITEAVVRGNLVVTVTATGRIQPVNQVDVGTEISGTIKSIEADFNQIVEVGQVLAKLDASKLEAQVLQSEASIASANASLLDAQASVFKADNNLKRLKKTWQLSGGKVPSEYDIDAATAELRSAKARESMAKAQIEKENAYLTVLKTDLTKAVICSPINGIVLLRNVELGQTVAASLQTPVLFTLAEDLTKMELSVSVDEADIGRIAEGQAAVFTVDAYPNREFPAQIIQVRNAPKTENAVVTYETILSVDNSDLLLRPGMTATAEITTEKVENAVLVPNAALRFTPPAAKAEPSEKKDGDFMSKLMPRPPMRGARTGRPNPGASKTEPRLWTLKDGQPEPTPVKTGLTDGIMTEIRTEEIGPGLQVIVDVERKAG